MADPSLQDIADKVDDLSRHVTRQSATLGKILDGGPRTGPDVPLLVDLHALHGDALACAVTTRARRERAAFEALASGLERLLAGRGGTLVSPRPGDAFSAATMEAAEVRDTDEAGLDRTVAALLEPGLQVDGRSVRPARVAVHRHRRGAPPEPTNGTPVG